MMEIVRWLRELPVATSGLINKFRKLTFASVLVFIATDIKLSEFCGS